jgi:mannitol/fructose-specific phosphotransferase system IIA component
MMWSSSMDLWEGSCSQLPDQPSTNVCGGYEENAVFYSCLVDDFNTVKSTLWNVDTIDMNVDVADVLRMEDSLMSHDEIIATIPLLVGSTSSDDNVLDVLTQLCDSLDGDAIMDQAAQMTAFDTILPPVSPDDVDSLLSSSPPPASSSSSPIASVATPICSPAPSRPLHVERRQRKKEQNKTAALRYRHKKRNEQGSVLSEYDELEKKNIELKTKVTEMTKEVDYLKGLIAEICA